jgi:flagellar biogenesis protein FliO
MVFMFGGDMSLAMRLILALSVILALIGLIVMLLKRFGVMRIGGLSLHGRQPRIAVMDMAHLDARRKLIIVRRDTVEHLVMIGGPNDVVIERGIVRGQPVASHSPSAPHKEEKTSLLPHGHGADISPAKNYAKPANPFSAPKTAEQKVAEQTPPPLGTLDPPSR